MEKGKWGIKFGIYSFILSRERIGLFPSFIHCGFCVFFSWFFLFKRNDKKIDYFLLIILNFFFLNILNYLIILAGFLFFYHGKLL